MHFKNEIYVLLLAFGASICGACASRHRSSPHLSQDRLGNIERLHIRDDVYLASQPAPADLEQAQRRGVKTVINLRRPDELDWDEKATAAELRMTYHNVPFQTPDEMTDETLDRLRSLLRDPQNRPLLLHCSSANRVGAVWWAYRVLDEGADLDAALIEARQVGLSRPGHEAKARQYIEKNRSPAVKNRSLP